MGVENGRCVGADAEKGRAGEIQHAGIAELNVQAERRHGVEQHRGDQQQNKMVLVKEDGDRESRQDREAAKHILVILEGTARRDRAAATMPRQ